MEDREISQRKLLDKYTEEWSLLQDSIQWNFSRQEKQVKYILIIVAIFFGLEEIGIGGVNLEFSKSQFWFFGAPVLLVLMYRISSPMYFISLKLDRQKIVERRINNLIEESGYKKYSNEDYPFSFQDRQFSESEFDRIWENPSTVLSALVAATSFFLVGYAEYRLFSSQENSIIVYLHILVIASISLLCVYQVYKISLRSKNLYDS